MRTSQTLTSTGPYQFLMLVLCVYALAALVVQVFVPLESETAQLLVYADWIVCAIFFIDFVVCLWRAEHRWRYFYTWGWLDLLSSIPVLDAARWGRVARLTRLIRVLRGIRATRYLLHIVRTQRRQSAIVGATLWVLVLVIAGSLAILHVETVDDANIRTAPDALWWAVTTVTTVGYGDRYPVTGAGRVIAGVLMTGGVGVFGLLSGLLAAWFVAEPSDGAAPSRDEGGAALDALRDEVRALREQLERSAGRAL